MPRLIPALLTLLCLAAMACAPALRRTVGALVYDGVPPLPGDARARQYLESRSASLYDWDEAGRGVFIGTRFGDSGQLHHVAAPLGMRRQLTFSREPTGGARAWRGARKGVVFARDTGGNEAYQLYFRDLERGTTRLITDGQSKNGNWLPHKSGQMALFTSTRRNGQDSDLYLSAGDEPGLPRLVTEVKGRVYPVDWSADGKLALVERYVSITDSQLFLLDVEKGALTPLESAPPAGMVARSHARFSQADADVVYFTSDEGGEFAGLYRLHRGAGKKELLTPGLRWDVDGLAVSPDATTLAYTVNEGGTSVLYLGPASSLAAAKRIALPLGLVGGLRFDPSGTRLGFSMTSPSSPTDVYSVLVATGAVTRWTESEVGGLDTQRFVAPELISYKTFDGREIPAWYYRPPNLPAGARAPVLVSIHGGPESQAMVYFSPFLQYLVNELGLAVLQPNVRGSAGYGKTYVKLDNGELREDSVKDIGALLDWIATRPELDASRVGVYGGSYGGYMVLASLVHHGARLRCGVDVVGISNFVTFLENTKAYRRELRRVEYGDERDPKMRAFLQRISPTTNAHRIKAPLFVVQGANDPRVPASEAAQIVSAVRSSGRDVWYLLANDEGHGFRRKTNLVAFLQSTAAFLRRHLLGATGGAQR